MDKMKGGDRGVDQRKKYCAALFNEHAVAEWIARPTPAKTVCFNKLQ